MEKTISVIIPMNKISKKFNKMMKQLYEEINKIEIVVVASEEIHKNIKVMGNVIIQNKNGRGHAIVQGIKNSSGKIIMVLHADTVLPNNWFTLIKEALENNSVSGGAFSLEFDGKNISLNIVVFLGKLFFYFKKELYGDQAMFFRRSVIKNCLKNIDIPLMEDIELSKCMKRKGKVILLKDKVRTSADKFMKRGIFRNIFIIAKTRTWYALGGKTNKLYNYYYSK